MPRTKKISRNADADSQQPIAVPAHIGLSVEETAVVARLVRLMRSRFTYLGLYIEFLLELDAGAAADVSIEDMETVLTEIKNIRNWRNYFLSVKTRHPALLRYTGLTSADESYCDDDEHEFRVLVAMWRKDHPQPQPGPPSQRSTSDDDADE